MDKYYADKLSAKGYMLTKRREAVFDILAASGAAHLSGEDIYRRLRQRGDKAGVSTVYRTLSIFDAAGIVKSMDFGDGLKRWELIDSRAETHSHHHLICLNCGAVTEAPEDMLDGLEKLLSQRFAFRIIDHTVKFYGYCRLCGAEDNNA